MTPYTHDYVFAVDLSSGEQQQALYAKSCSDMELPWRHDNGALLVECRGEHVAPLLALFSGQKFLMAPLQSTSPLETDRGMCSPCRQAMYNHFSRRAHSRWWRSVDWFEVNKAQFKAGEYVVIRDAAVLHRTRSEREHREWLPVNGDADTLAHHMVEDGKEMIYRL